ncbi:lipopolysaccharide transporter, partial [bacteria symbiont BFo2 of Frankliniella occidentalis]
MKFKNKSSLNLLLASGLLALSLPALAVTGDSDQPVHINS